MAQDLLDEEKIRNVYFKKILKRIESKVNQKIEDKIIFKKSFCVNDFKSRYNAYNGNAYGLANTLFQTAIFKPKMKDAKIKNLYYSGHFIVPGPGLPPAIISGKISIKTDNKGCSNMKLIFDNLSSKISKLTTNEYSTSFSFSSRLLSKNKT